MPTTRVPCTKAAKTRNPLKLAGVPQTNEHSSAASALKFTILQGHVGKVLLFNKFFSDCRYLPSCEDIARQSCAMVPIANFWQYLCPVFSASRMQHVSDLHPKFALRPHHVWDYGRLYIQCATAEIRL